MTSHRSRDFSSLSSSSPTSPGASGGRRRERSYSPSSRYGACSSPTRGAAGGHHFSSSSLTGYGGAAYPKVRYNKRLLTPLNLDIDPDIQEIRSKEKDEIKALNNQFASLIGKVQSLEQHNQVLLTRWDFLREQDNSLTELDIKLLYDQYMNKLRQQIRSIDAEKEQLDLELDEVLDAMDTFRRRYEDEINKRTAMEFTFTTLKKDLDNGFLHKTELEAKLHGLHAMAELMKMIHEQELEEAMSQIKDVSVVLGIDNSGINIDPHRIVEDVRAQYEALAIRSWEELEELTRSKLNEGELQSVKYGDRLLNDRRVIAELNIEIQKMRSCILSLKSQCLRLEGTIKEAGGQGEAALNDAKTKLASLEEALQNLRQDLTHLVKQYQELMNIKLALDIEILTYRELMEGEEISMESPAFAFISRIYSGPKFPSLNSSTMTTSNVASRTREDSAVRMSHSRGSLESGLSRSQSGGSGGASGGDLSRSHSNASGRLPTDLKNPSRGTSESNLSRNPSSRSGNLADVENTTESSTSRSHGSGSFSQPDFYGSRSSRDNQESGLSRSASGGTSGGSLSRSQSNRSGGLTDSVFVRTSSDASEGVSEGSLSRSHSGTSTSFVEGSLSRSQSDENEDVSGPGTVRTSTAEDGGVPVGGPPSRRASRGNSGGRLSRGQSDENETPSRHGKGGYVEPTVSRTNSAEDGGVPVGGPSRSHSETSRYRSEGSSPRSQSAEGESQGSCKRGGFVEAMVFRINTAEDGGVPVGSIPRSQSEVNRYSPESSIPRLHRGEDEARSSHKREAYAEPTGYRPGSAGGDAVRGSGISRSHGGTGRDISAGRLSRSQSDNKTAFVESGVSRSHSDGAKGVTVSSGFRTASIGSTAITESAAPCTAGEDVQEEMLSRVHSGAAENVPEAGLSRSQSGDSQGPVETSTPICYSGRKEDAVEHSLSRSQSEESASFRGVSEASLSRTCSKENDLIPEGKFSRNDSYLTAVSQPVVSRTSSSEVEDSPRSGIEAPLGSPGDGNETSPQSGHGGIYSHEESQSRTPSGESASPGPTYLVSEVHSDNYHYSPTREAGY